MACLFLDIRTLRSNFDLVAGFCRNRNLELLAVTKVIQSRPDILAALGPSCPGRIADVHGTNFAGLAPLRFPVRAILRPRFGDVETVAQHATRVFLSDPSLALRLAEARTALRPGTPLEVTLMVETGDLRDGIPWDQVAEVVRGLGRVSGISLVGLGTNLGCLAGAVPDARLTGRMVEELGRVRRITGHPLPEFSVGGTVFWDVAASGTLPPEVTELRIGEAAFFGWNTSLGRAIPGLSQDVFRLDLEVLEVWDKMVERVPPGPTGFNAFGQPVVQALTGLRRRAVLDGGENLAPIRALTSLGGYQPMGETHEYTVVDCQDARPGPAPGGLVSFRPGYEAVARSFLSPFLELKFEKSVGGDDQ